MRATGIVKNTDMIGRICIPKSIRKVLRIEPGDPLEFFVEGSQIIISPYKKRCVFCGEENLEELKPIARNYICMACAQKIISEANDHE